MRQGCLSNLKFQEFISQNIPRLSDFYDNSFNFPKINPTNPNLSLLNYSYSKKSNFYLIYLYFKNFVVLVLQKLQKKTKNPQILRMSTIFPKNYFGFYTNKLESAARANEIFIKSEYE